MASPDTANQSIFNKARKDKFILSFTTPNCIKSIESKDVRYTHHKSLHASMPDKMQYSVHGAVVPSISIPSETLGKYGQNLKISTHTRDPYDDVTVNFAIDNQFNNFWYIYTWLNVLNDYRMSGYDARGIGQTGPVGQAMGSNPNPKDTNPPKLLEDYQTDITLFGLNEYNKEVIKITYSRAFPVQLGGIEYSYRDAAEIDSSFTFSFSQLLVELLD